MFHPNEVSDHDDNVMTPRPDLPSFQTGEQVAQFLTSNQDVSSRDGKFVKLTWQECQIPCTICAKSAPKLNGGW